MIIDTALAARLIVTQFPQLADLPIKQVEFGGWDNRTFHLGEHMPLPSAGAYATQVEKEHGWLPRLAQPIESQFLPRHAGVLTDRLMRLVVSEEAGFCLSDSGCHYA